MAEDLRGPVHNTVRRMALVQFYYFKDNPN
jgi:hypothetical protein